MVRKLIPLTFVLIVLVCFFVVLSGLFVSCKYEKETVVPCDTSIVSYNADIMSILDANCKQCHSPENAPIFGNNYNLYDHSIISTLALDGNFTYGTLLSAVKHEGGAPEMPRPAGSPKISDCEINTIAAWVHQGALDN